MRDSDKAKVYAAEQQWRRTIKTPGMPIHLAGTTVITPDEIKFGEVEHIQQYVDQVWCLPVVRGRLTWGRDMPTVRKRKGHTKAHYERGNHVIAVPDNLWALRESVVLHEMAHAATPGLAHGAGFRAAFVELVECAMGPEARFLLQMNFFEQGLTA